MRVAILALDPCEPWITENRPVTPWKIEALRNNRDQQDLRSYWTRFVQKTAEAFDAHGHKAEILTVPRWEITSRTINDIGADLTFVPHAHASGLPGLDRPAMFYMQVMQRWLFSADPNGWGPEASGYPHVRYRAGDPDGGSYEALRARIVESNISKFEQPAPRTRTDLERSGDVPARPYIFFPCQIPHDEAITRFSPRPEIDIVRALSTWSERRDVPIVFKEHPANRASMRDLKAIASGPSAFWSDASVHDLIVNAAAVYTINSGVGFEALLQGGPVVTFGRADYDCVTMAGEIDDLDTVWARVEAWNRAEGVAEYRRYVDWFCRSYAIDLSALDALRDRMALLVKQGEALVVTNRGVLA